MALINCPECNKEISDKVKACPHCGFPMDESIQKVEVVKSKQIYFILGFILILAISFLIGIKIRNDKLKEEQRKIEESYLTDYKTAYDSLLLYAAKCEKNNRSCL